MAYHDQFARNLAQQRGGECAHADEGPVRFEPLNGLPGLALGTGQGRETRTGESHVSRLRSTRTENLSCHSRDGGEPPSVCAQPEEILNQVQDDKEADDDGESGDDEEGALALPRPLLQAGWEKDGSRLHPGCGDAAELGGNGVDGADEPEKREAEGRHCERSAAIQSGEQQSGLPRRSAPRNDGLGVGKAEPRDDASAHFPTPTPPLKGRGLERRSTRHDGWNPEIRVKFLNALANCGNVQSAVLFVQRSRTSAYALKRRDVDFATAWDAALLLARDVATDTLQDRAINGVEEDVMYHGEVVATRRRYDSRLLLAHIARLDKLAEDRSTSRAAARFEDVTQAIAAEKDVTPLITEPTEAEKREQARVLAALGLPAEEVPEPEEPEVPFECTYKDDPPEIYMMTQDEADALAAEVAGLTVRAVDGADAVTAMAVAKDVPEEGLEADHAGPEEKKHDPVHIVNFGEEEERN